MTPRRDSDQRQTHEDGERGPLQNNEIECISDSANSRPIGITTLFCCKNPSHQLTNNIQIESVWSACLNFLRRFRCSFKSKMQMPNPRDGPTPARRNCQVIFSQFGLAIHQNDHQARRRFVKWAQNEIAVVPDFHKRILFSDEADFWLNGCVNKQNCLIWSEANPQVYVETPLHPEKLTVWCALLAGEIPGPYFFKNDEGHNVTFNGDRYTAMIIFLN
ncbi:hypothetical protein TNCV_3184251 [Trichonephila clavipes]|nr:hypothetical protein TNCV_3184251 [Trichonephila clavipes]